MRDVVMMECNSTGGVLFWWNVLENVWEDGMNFMERLSVEGMDEVMMGRGYAAMTVMVGV